MITFEAIQKAGADGNMILVMPEGQANQIITQVPAK